MKHILVFLLLAVSSTSFAGPSTPMPSEVRALLDSGRPGGAQKARLGTQLVDKKVQVLKAVYDFSVLGGALSGTAITLKDEGGKDATLPNKAVIKQVIFDVITAPTSGGSATIQFGTQSTPTNFKAATAIASYTGIVAGVPVGTAATSVKLAAESTVKALIATAALTAGKINVFIEYYVSD